MKQTCPHCKTENNVFGLVLKKSESGGKSQPVMIRCVKCGVKFEAKERKWT